MQNLVRADYIKRIHAPKHTTRHPRTLSSAYWLYQAELTHRRFQTNEAYGKYNTSEKLTLAGRRFMNGTWRLVLCVLLLCVSLFLLLREAHGWIWVLQQRRQATTINKIVELFGRNPNAASFSSRSKLSMSSFTYVKWFITVYIYIDVHICTQRIHVDVFVLYAFILGSYLSPGHPGWQAPG